MEKYINQKAQKIVAALYLVTDFIKDSDAIKWEIREEGISFVSSALMLNTTLPVEKDHAIQMLTSTAEKLTSLLNISMIASLISRMNASILIEEIKGIVDYLDKHNKEIAMAGYILSDSFFATDIAAPSDSSVDKKYEAPNKPVIKPKNKEMDIKDKKNDRQESIINLLKKESNLTIKDFAKVIKDCSEKTIQRELIALVEKGVVKKEGERRWSTYSLA